MTKEEMEKEALNVCITIGIPRGNESSAFIFGYLQARQRREEEIDRRVIEAVDKLHKAEKEIERLKEGVETFRNWLVEESNIENIPDEIYFPFINLLEEAK